MNKDQFKKELDKKDYKWREEGEWIIVEEPGYVDLDPLETIPDNVEFNNGDFVILNSLKSMGDNVQFRNRGNVYLDSLKTIGNNIQFNNSQYHVHLGSLESIPINSDIDEMFPKCKNIYINGGWINDIHFSDSRWKSVKKW